MTPPLSRLSSEKPSSRPRSPRGCETKGASGPGSQDGGRSVPGAEPWELAVPWPVAVDCGRSGVVAASPGTALLQKSLRFVLRPGQVSEGLWGQGLLGGRTTLGQLGLKLRCVCVPGKAMGTLLSVHVAGSSQKQAR